MTESTTDIPILDDAAIAELANRDVCDHNCAMLTPTERNALCQTVRVLRAALRDHGEHESHCKSNERYPSPDCDCVLAQYFKPQAEIQEQEAKQ